MINVEWNKPKDAAETMKTVLGDYSLRAWDRFHPSRYDNIWWLLPSTEWPAHDSVKLFFDANRSLQGKMLGGLHIEKGLGSEALQILKVLYPGKKYQSLIMDNSWAWNSFKDHLRSGEVRKTIQEIYSETGHPLIIRIEVSPIESSTGQKDVAVFETDGSELQVKEKEDGYYLSELTEVESFEKLYEPLFKIKDPSDEEWDDELLWIDLFIGQDFESRPDRSTWDASKVWNKLFKPLTLIGN